MQAIVAVMIPIVISGIAPTISIDAGWLQKNGPGPYVLNQAGATYILEADVVTSGPAFRIVADGVTFDLNGHTITFDNSAPITVPDGGFEAGDLNEWDVSAAPAVKAVPQVMMWGRWMCRV